MHLIVEKFEMFDGAKARPFLLDFQHNYTLVVSGLEQSLSLVRDETSKRSIILAKLAVANEALREAAAVGAHFMRRDASRPSREIQCRCGATGLPPAFLSAANNNNPQYRGMVTCPNSNCRITFTPEMAYRERD